MGISRLLCVCNYTSQPKQDENENLTDKDIVNSDVPGRALGASTTTTDTMTNEECVAYCEGAGFPYAGTEWYGECCMWNKPG